jgi:hypothetical protein
LGKFGVGGFGILPTAAPWAFREETDLPFRYSSMMEDGLGPSD